MDNSSKDPFFKKPHTQESIKHETILTMVFRSSLLPVLTGILVWNELLSASLVNAKVACSTKEECEQILGHGSKCSIVAGDDGSSSQFCSNPFYEGGCLARFLPNWHKIRVCGSDDPPEASISGACRSAPIPAYQEIRIGAMNWYVLQQKIYRIVPWRAHTHSLVCHSPGNLPFLGLGSCRLC